MKNFSLSSVEDVYDFLNKLSFIYEGKHKNDEMFSVYCKFINLIRDINDNKYINVYHDIQVGKINVRGKKGNILEVCSKLLGVNEEIFKKKLEQNVSDLVNANLIEWRNYINNKYKNVYFYEEFKKVERLKETLKDTNEKKIVNCGVTPLKADITKKNVCNDVKKEEDLKDLVEYEQQLEEKINKLTQEGKSETRECRKLVGIRIDVRKDINIIRRSYGEVLGRQNSRGRTTFTSYDHENKEIRYIIEAHEKYLNDISLGQLEEFEKEEKIKKIRKVAEEVLTNRQFIIFELYYFNELTQQEIADLTGILQPNVNRDIKNSIEKIKEKIMV